MKPVILTAATSSPAREEELVARAQDGNSEAFEVLFRRYREAIAAYVRARVRDDGRTEDIVQEIFISAHNSLGTLSHPRAFRSWLYQIAQNACLDEARRRARNEELILGWDEFPPPDERIVIQNRSPHHEFSQKEELARLKSALGGLPPSQHDALVMRELEGRSYDEIGERMQMTPGAVESVLFRARRGLKRAYSKAAAFLPLPAFLRRSGEEASGSIGAQAQGAAAQLSTMGGDQAVSLVHKAAAVVAAIAVVGGGTAAIETTGVLHSSPAKKDIVKPEANVVGPAPVHKGAAGRGGSGPPGGNGHPKAAAGGGGFSPSVASPPPNVPSAVASPGAPTVTAPTPAAPDTSSPAKPVTPPSSGSNGSNGSQGNQPSANTGGGNGSSGGGSSNSTQGTKPAKPPPPQLTTPSGQQIPTSLPKGIQKQLESGKKTLDDLPPGLQKKLAKGSSTSAAATTTP